MGNYSYSRTWMLLEDLDVHLTTCEYFKCDICKEKIWQFSKVKEHFISKHKSVDGTRQGIRNVKPSRDNSELYEEKFHTLISLFLS